MSTTPPEDDLLTQVADALVASLSESLASAGMSVRSVTVVLEAESGELGHSAVCSWPPDAYLVAAALRRAYMQVVGQLASTS